MCDKYLPIERLHDIGYVEPLGPRFMSPNQRESLLEDVKMIKSRFKNIPNRLFGAWMKGDEAV